MAIWQFSIYFIPRENLLKRFGFIPKTIEDEILWTESLEEGVGLPTNYEIHLSKLGEKEILKWTKQSFNWGDYDDGSHITIDCQDKNSVSVFCRFHVGQMSESFVKTVLDFASLCNCLLFTKNQTIIEPEIDLFIKEVENSNSYRFCTNPIEYLQSDEVKQLNWDIKRKLSE